MQSWVWFLIGLGMLAVEALTPSFFFLFFGAAGICVGALSLIGVDSASLQVLTFGTVAIGSMVLFRGTLTRRFRSGKEPAHTVDPIVGEIALLRDDLAPGAAGHAEFRGTPWSARNATHAPMQKGQRCRIERVEGLTLVVVPE